MARPPIPVGSYGNISYRTLGSRKIRALAKIRDTDGVLRDVTREGTSKDAAKRALLEAIDNRPGFGGSQFTAESRLEEIAVAWLEGILEQVASGERAPNTPRVYDSVLRQHVNPALGKLRLREASVTRCDAFIRSMRTHHGTPLSKTARTVLNGVLGYAVRHGLIAANPMRDVARIEGGDRRQARALTDVERDRWLQEMEGDEVAVRHDLPDLTRVMLATGCRIGEVLALDWACFDVDDKTLAVDWTIVPGPRGAGLLRTPTKTRAGRRTLNLPGWAVDMLIERHAAAKNKRGPIFPSRAGTWRDPSNTARSLREARERAGFGWVTAHAFRKTVATALHEAGLSPRVIADQLGHANLRTLDHYIGRRAVGRDAAAALEVGWGDSVE